MINRLVLNTFQQSDADVFLFGSRATGEEHAFSDYDVGYCSSTLSSAAVFADLQETLDELPIPAHVELVYATNKPHLDSCNTPKL